MKEENNQSEIILYKTDDGRIKVDTIFQNVKGDVHEIMT
jgi:hypothetical protein